MKAVPVFAMLLMLGFCTSCRQNQKDNLKSEDSSTSQVPNSMVWNVKQDRNGNILIASYKAVFRYDGKSFRNFTSKDGLPANAVTTIIEDKTGKLWIGTTGEACVYDGKNITDFTSKKGH